MQTKVNAGNVNKNAKSKKAKVKKYKKCFLKI